MSGIPRRNSVIPLFTNGLACTDSSQSGWFHVSTYMHALVCDLSIQLLLYHYQVHMTIDW